MVLDANGNDIGQALALKVSLSAVRIKDERARSEKAMKEKRDRKERGLDSNGSWISMSLSNLTSDFSLERNDSWASKNSQGSQGSKGRIVKETYLDGTTNATLQLKYFPAPAPSEQHTYIPSKYMYQDTNGKRRSKPGGGWMGLFRNYVCDGREDAEDSDSTYTAHRDERGAVIYEV
jgi:hypothetical protein